MRHRTAGLTLVEVMLALAILGVGITALVATASKCVGVARKARNYEHARRLFAHVELEEPLFGTDIEEGTEDGSFPHPFNKYKWTRKIEAEGDEEDGLYKVTTRIAWSESAGQSFEEIVTYLHAPEEKKGGSFESR